jgi:hypothetical protein
MKGAVMDYYKKRTFHDAAITASVGESIYQKSRPKILYAVNHNTSLYNRVPKCRQDAKDWCIYDPKEQTPKDRTI